MQKYLKISFILIVFCSFLEAKITTCINTGKYPDCGLKDDKGNSSGWTAHPAIEEAINEKNCDQILNYKYYQVCYSYKFKGPLFIAFSTESTDGAKSFYYHNNLRKGEEGGINVKGRKKADKAYGTPDTRIPEKYRGELKDYYAKIEYKVPTLKSIQKTNINPKTMLSAFTFFEHDTQGMIEASYLPNIVPLYDDAKEIFNNVLNDVNWMLSSSGHSLVLIAILYGKDTFQTGKNQISVPTQIVYMGFGNYMQKQCYIVPNKILYNQFLEEGKYKSWDKFVTPSNFRISCKQITEFFREHKFYTK